RIGERGDPCGMPLSTGSIVLRFPSRQTAASRSSRKLAMKRTISIGTRRVFSSLRSLSWLTKSK
ncbi:uncharacterized protein SCHCODRAFT_02512292, partial [Schizophyllum commune H4-8]|uniref:uncharacterized protein n=1 Tax=Schizophyllum commune (strain H4-8 / FGSC 9210) TaxID=578458 RepID=UPI002160F2CD